MVSPFNPNVSTTEQTDVAGAVEGRLYPARFTVSAANAVAPSTTGVHAAVTDNGAQQVITTAITNPAVPRNLTATSGGTAANITAVSVVVAGTDYAGNAITETLPVFTAGSATTVVGNKAFKTVTSITIPANGSGVTTALGWGAKLGLPDLLPFNTVFAAYLNAVREGTAPTVATDAANISGNTLALNSALNGTQVDAIYFV